jgi:tetratricopeptide (TPR) repeat protein
MRRPVASGRAGPGSLLPRFLLKAVLAGACACLLVALPGAEISVLEDGTTAQLTALGNEALLQGRYETAIEHYHRALANDAQSFEALFNLALAYQQLGKSDEAKHWYQEALKVSSEHPEVLCNLGYLAFRSGDYAQAVDRFQEAAHLASTSPQDAADYWFNAGTARERLKQWDEARRDYEECIALNSQHFGANYNLGTLYLRNLSEAPGSLEKALGFLTRARELGPNRPEAYLNLALCHERANSDAEADYNQAIKVSTPAQVDEALWQRALYYNRLQPPRRTAMRDDLMRILADDANFPHANGMLGAYRFSTGEFDLAITLLEREVANPHFDPNYESDIESHYLLALIYTDNRPDPAKALQHATAYYQYRPDSAKIHELRRRALRVSPPPPSDH